MSHNPGDPEATRSGCACDPRVNRYGKGAGENGRGETLFVTNARCEMHGDDKARERGRKRAEKAGR
jgi:hypothetical protein